ncbi:hypothetical protein CRG98_037463 [Punica granatum]|uniref:Uncharacterized protein n=1 Tax=Punica granatum TaxID=22663 RepID=A0A2I0IDS8_PUNGR|nr:hypothetical protein CRG98_037463 [Punica granatum]
MQMNMRLQELPVYPFNLECFSYLNPRVIDEITQCRPPQPVAGVDRSTGSSKVYESICDTKTKTGPLKAMNARSIVADTPWDPRGPEIVTDSQIHAHYLKLMPLMCNLSSD